MPRLSLRAARFVLANPASVADRPALYPAAWAQLKAQRGQVINPRTMGPPRHQIVPAAATPLNDRIIARARAHAKKIGITRPFPLILPGSAA